jgi:hypothetical protein
MKFELTFEDPPPRSLRWRRWHPSVEAAEAEAAHVYQVLDHRMLARPRYSIADGDGRVAGSTLITRLAERLS